MHEPYEKRFNHKADFRLKYKFLSSEEGGRKTGEPYEGIRSDFSFVDEKQSFLYMIWPEFEDEEGSVILFNDRPVPQFGTARMWIINNEMREDHYGKNELGIRGNFREGATITADCEIIEILDSKINPTHST